MTEGSASEKAGASILIAQAARDDSVWVVVPADGVGRAEFVCTLCQLILRPALFLGRDGIIKIQSEGETYALVKLQPRPVAAAGFVGGHESSLPGSGKNRTRNMLPRRAIARIAAIA